MSILKSLRRAASVLCLLALASACADVSAETRPLRSEVGGEPVTSILWVGNSFFYYNNSMHGHYSELAKAAEPGSKHRGTSVTISGSGLDWHDVASYLKPDGVGKYSFVPGNRIVFNKPGKQFDAVIMIDCASARSIRSWRSRFATRSRKTPPSSRSTARGRCSSCPGPTRTSRR